MTLRVAATRARVAFLVCLAVSAWSGAAQAVTLLLGLEPGKSTRGDTDRVLGPAVRVDGTAVEYAPRGGSGPIVVTFRDGHVIDRIDVGMTSPVARDALAPALNLPAEPDGTRVEDGRRIEYYGTPNLLVVSYQTSEASSGIVGVGYYSAEPFARATAGLTLRTREAAASAAVSLSSAADAPTIMQFSPSGCADVYAAATAENRVARSSRSAARRQAILAVMVAAQRGDCAAARALFDTYKLTYR